MSSPCPSRALTRLLAAGLAGVLAAVAAAPPARADNDALQHAVNYLFTGRVDPGADTAPEIVERAGCVVVVPRPQDKDYVRYYLGRFDLDAAFVDKTYSGAQARYTLDVKGAATIVEYLGRDKRTVQQAYKSVQISLPGELDLINRALARIGAACKDNKPKADF
ncbi:MAG TPA: hypothetical protein VFB45_05415 [Pseudolabrys sp.]|nr:hypothetical protein [Pseudolabrys sp.]